jgi:hypothetical protein
LSADGKELVEKYRLLHAQEQKATMRYLDFLHTANPVVSEHESTNSNKED